MGPQVCEGLRKIPWPLGLAFKRPPSNYDVSSIVEVAHSLLDDTGNTNWPSTQTGKGILMAASLWLYM